MAQSVSRTFEAGSADAPRVAGPVLFSRGSAEGLHRLAALMVMPVGAVPPSLSSEAVPGSPPVCLAELQGLAFWRYEFALPSREASRYSLVAPDGREIGPFAVAPVDRPSMAIAYVSCNGQETGDAARDPVERDAMWMRLAAEHERRPFALLLQGGDQIYADEALAAHATVAHWKAAPADERPAMAFEPDAFEAVQRFFLARYLAVFAQADVARLSACVPSAMMWDDHDIMDGWGSLPEPVLDSPIGQGVFRIARDLFCLFQRCEAPGERAAALGYALRFQGLSLIAPDLRSERRPTRVMGEEGWRGFDEALAETPKGDRLLLLSSVPALGPRLSWLEAAGDLLPGGHSFEDDLRDQWQSRSHRAEWRRLLGALAGFQAGGRGKADIVSGEIHLASQGEMKLPNGSVIRQFIASGISHPAPPRAYPWLLGTLSRFGDSPVEACPIRMRALPGRRTVYTAERNYLVLLREGANWTAEWELERSGRSPALAF